MLIRSQDKARLINLNNVEKIYIYGMINNGITRYKDLENEEADYFVIGTPTARLGAYRTKEAAIKVLDMIQDAWEDQTEKFRYSFQMPQDEEVEV